MNQAHSTRPNGNPRFRAYGWRTAITPDTESITIELDSCDRPDTTVTLLFDPRRHPAGESQGRGPLLLVKYWAIDPDFNGENFRPIWQSHRHEPIHDSEDLRSRAEFNVFTRDGDRTVCVRAIDRFGRELTVVLTLPADE